MTFAITDLGFSASYEVDVNPEYPAAGDWRMPDFVLGRGSGDTLTIRFRPTKGSPWVASFAAEERGRLINGVFRCPHPNQVLVAAGTNAYLVDVTRPGVADDLPIRPVVDVQKPSGTDLLVIGSFTNLAAIDAAGLRWVSGRLFMDDLDLIEGPPGKIYVRGSVRSVSHSPELLIVDPARGDLIDGLRYTDVEHRHGEPGWRRPGI